MSRRARCVLALALPLIAGCFPAEPYESSRNVTMLKHVHVNSLVATERGAWYLNADDGRDLLTYGFVDNGGNVTQHSFRLSSDEPLLPYQGWGNHVQPVDAGSAYVSVINAENFPHEDGIALVSLQGKPPVLAASHDLPDFGGLALVNGRLFIGLASRALGELRRGHFALHTLRNDPNAPWSTAIVVAGTHGRVYAADGQTNRFGIYDVARETWRYVRFRDRGSFSPMAAGDGDEVWLYSLNEGRLVLANVETGNTVMEMAFPDGAEWLAPVSGGGVCAVLAAHPQVACVSRSGKVVRYDLTPPMRGEFVATSGGRLWYAITGLKAPIWLLGDPDWGSAVGRTYVGKP